MTQKAGEWRGGMNAKRVHLDTARTWRCRDLERKLGENRRGVGERVVVVVGWLARVYLLANREGALDASWSVL